MDNILNLPALFLSFVMVIGCIRESSPPHVPSETEKIHTSIHEFFGAVESSDWSAAQKNVTDDFLLIEDGHRMNFKDLRQMMETAGYTQLALKPENFQTHMEGNRAYTVYDNYVHYQTEEGDGKVHYIESAVLRYDADINNWKFVMAHVSEANETRE